MLEVDQKNRGDLTSLDVADHLTQTTHTRLNAFIQFMFQFFLLWSAEPAGSALLSITYALSRLEY